MGFSGQEIDLRKAPILFEKTVLHDEDHKQFFFKKVPRNVSSQLE